MNTGKMIVSFAVLLTFAGAAFASDINFKPANSSGTAVAENKSRPPAPAPQASGSSQPGFWEKEGKRSGLSDTAHGIGGSVRNFFRFGWIKQKEDEYRTRNPQSK